MNTSRSLIQNLILVSLIFGLLSASIFHSIAHADVVPPRLDRLLNVFGDDGRRQVLDPSQKPYSMVGLFRDGKGHNATAFLIGPNRILTNFHTLNIDQADQANDATTDSSVRSMRFEAGHDRGSSLATAQVKKIVAHSKEDDWAILELDQNLGNDLGWFHVRPKTLLINQDLKVSMIGYHGDLGDRLTVQNCHLKVAADLYLSETEIGHDCDTTAGSSGSPLFHQLPNGEYELLALNSGQMVEKGKKDDHFVGNKLNRYNPDYTNRAVRTEQFSQAIYSAQPDSFETQCKTLVDQVDEAYLNLVHAKFAQDSTAGTDELRTIKRLRLQEKLNAIRVKALLGTLPILNSLDRFLRNRLSPKNYIKWKRRIENKKSGMSGEKITSDAQLRSYDEQEQTVYQRLQIAARHATKRPNLDSNKNSGCSLDPSSISALSEKAISELPLINPAAAGSDSTQSQRGN